MIQPRHSGWALTLLFLFSSAVPAHAAKVEFFDDIDPGPQQLGQEAHRYLAFGEVMFDYYSHSHFSAINQLLINREAGLFDAQTDYAELVLGDLYITYGLPIKAEAIFDNLLEEDILKRTRAETWLHKASLHYREGRLDAAEDILDSDKMQGLAPQDDAKRRLMLANVRMANEDFASALSYLESVPGNTDEGRFATYNGGVALIREGMRKKGLKLLDSLAAAGGDSDTALALKDRAALAAGLTRLRHKKLDAARQSLRRVRSDGPFSEDALLALGLVNYRRGDLKHALPLWLEAVNRNSSQTSVQEALLLAPQAYEELGGLKQALSGYQYAAQEYREALKDVRRATRNIKKDDWATSLLPENLDKTGKLLTTEAKMAQANETAHLYKLFSSKEFTQRFRHYQQISQIKATLDQWQRALPALEESYRTQQRELKQGLATVRKAMTEVISRQETLASAGNALANDIPDFVDIREPANVATAEQSVMWKKVDALAHQFSSLSGATHRNAIRLRQVRGLLLWDIASQAEEQRKYQLAASSQLQEDNALLQRRVEAVRSQIRGAALRLESDLGQRLAAQKQRIETQQKAAQDIQAQLEQTMRQEAVTVLQASQKRLVNKLAEAHLAIARLQDDAVTGTQQQGAQ